jgi:hypothetical protein
MNRKQHDRESGPEYWNPMLIGNYTTKKLTDEFKKKRYGPNKLEKVFEKRLFIKDRGDPTLNRRCKINMCAYGSCREEFYAYGDPGSGSRIYCKPHTKFMMLVRQRKYNRKNRESVNKTNKAWWIKNGGASKQHEYYLKRKAEGYYKKKDL